MGDVLFQVHFLALLLEERGAGDLAAVADAMAAKLIRRHPHVFEESEARALLGGAGPETAARVLANWDRIKRELEGRGGGGDPFDDVPESLPALLYARKMLRRAASAGLEEEPEPPPSARVGAEEEGRIGAALFALVREARAAGVDPELALRAEADRFRDESSAPG